MPRFYQEHFNLNELTKRDLADCSQMLLTHFSSKLFAPGRRYTFPELKVLHGEPSNYALFYLALRSENVDYRIKVFRQLTKRNALRGFHDENDLAVLAGYLDKKPLHDWRKEELGHIKGLGIQDTVALVIHLEQLFHLLPSIRDRTDAMLALRNLEQLDQCDTMEALKSSLFYRDPDWLALADKMSLTDEFKAQYQDTIIQFLRSDGAGIAKTYLNRLESEYCPGFHRVVKAELMGQFSTLKYYEGDLDRELGCTVSEQVQKTWPQNLSVTDNGIAVSERDDFFSTILLGTQPYRTCLSYRDGDYRHCLLACFDSNKKLLYAEKDGIVVGRASIRLTKCRLSGTGKKSPTSNEKFDFADLESIAASRDADQDHERVTLFLERPYISNAGPQDTATVNALFIQLARKKARELDAMLVLSFDYADQDISGFVQTTLNIYISASKAGEQYLDSLGGDASVSDQGSYSENRFLVEQSADILADICQQNEKRSLDL